MNPILPDERLLKKLFRHFNCLYWNNSLPDAPVRWNHSMLTAGRCYTSSTIYSTAEHEIVLSWKYHLHFPCEVRTSLKHEMIHLMIFNHDEQFQQEAARVGTRIHSHILTFPQGRYKYQCKRCRTIYDEDTVGLLLPCPRCQKTDFGKPSDLLEFIGMRQWYYNKLNSLSMLSTIG